MTKYAAQNTYIYIADGTGTAFYKVNGVQDIAGPAIKANVIDVSTQDETDHYMDWLSTQLDSGNVTFPVVFDPNDPTQNETPGVDGTNAGGLKWLMEQRLKRAMKMVFSYTSPTCRMTWTGIVVGFKVDAKIKGNLAASLDIKVTGKCVLAVGT